MSQVIQQGSGSAPFRRSNGRPIAIIGLGCRFAGASSPAELWEVLREGRDTTSDVPANRFDAAALHSAAPQAGKLLSRRGGFFERIDEFDAEFFGLDAEESTWLDPQQRLLLMTAWEAFEDAGLPTGKLAGSRTAVFIGHMHADYATRQYRRGLEELRPAMVKNYRSLLAGRLSYEFDLRGPSVSLDTACSSSLVAIHLACQSLRAGETSLAIAGGSNLKLVPDEDVLFSQVRMIARDGRSKFGDARADGFCPSDGIGVVVLKRLEDAVRDGDRVRAVILGGAVSNDGVSGGRVLRPSVEGQIQTMRWAYDDAGVAPSDVDFIEAHGTGTPLIDPLEFKAFGEVFGPGRPLDRPLLVGSVKTNVGHAEGAAAMASLTKLVLCLEHGEIPASLHMETPNPAIDWRSLPIVVPTSHQVLPDRGRPALAGMSGQGLSAVNAHLVLRAATPIEARGPQRAPAPGRLYVFALSARSPGALRDLARAYTEHVGPRGAGAEHALRDLCYSATMRRTHHPLRAAMIVADKGALARELGAFAAGERSAVTTADEAATAAVSQAADELDALVRRYVTGEDVDWAAVADPGARYVPLPTYPWQMSRYWQE
jgi:acyl transferase domain-containing protein